jgi:hypothetical protein
MYERSHLVLAGASYPKWTVNWQWCSRTACTICTIEHFGFALQGSCRPHFSLERCDSTPKLGLEFCEKLRAGYPKSDTVTLEHAQNKISDAGLTNDKIMRPRNGGGAAIPLTCSIECCDLRLRAIRLPQCASPHRMQSASFVMVALIHANCLQLQQGMV